MLRVRSCRSSPVNGGLYYRCPGVELGSGQQHAVRRRDDELQRLGHLRLNGELLEFNPTTGQQVATITLPG